MDQWVIIETSEWVISASEEWVYPGEETIIDLHSQISAQKEVLQDLNIQIASAKEKFEYLKTQINASDISIEDLHSSISSAAETVSDLVSQITASAEKFYDLNTQIFASDLTLQDLNSQIVAIAETLQDLSSQISAKGEKFYDLASNISAMYEVIGSIYDLNSYIEAKAQSLIDLYGSIEANSAIPPTLFNDLVSYIDVQYPIWRRFLLVRYDHTPVRYEQNVLVDKIIQFSIYNPDPAFSIDLNTFKIRINGGSWYRYEDSRLMFTKVNYREYLVYFNPPNFTYDSQVDVEVYCEDNFNNPGIKLEIL